MQLYDYQALGVAYLREHTKVGLFDEMGLGKTVQALHVLPDHAASLIICPKSLTAEWVAAVQQWTPNRQLFSVKLTSPEGWKALHEGAGAGSLGIINYAALPRYMSNLMKVPFGFLIVDEAHYVKSRKALRSANVRILNKRIPRLALLTGTPPLHKPEELWHMLHLISPGVFKSYWRFFEKHVKYWKVPTGGKSPVGIKDKEAYTKVIAPYFLRRLKRDVLSQLPPVQIIDVPVDLDFKTRRLYDKVLKDELRDAEGQPLHFPNVLAKLTALRKLATSLYVVTNELSPCTKIDTLLEKIGGLGNSQFIVFTHFKATKRLVWRWLDDKGISWADVDHLEEWKSGRAQCLVDTSYKGGLGLNLQQAGDLFFIEPPNGYTNYVQALARIDRPGGSASPRRIWRLFSTDTVDVHFFNHLDKMGERATEVDLALAVWRSITQGE